MLDQLEALRALQETGTTGRAAARLRLTQSAVSKRVAALEERVGTPLVERHGRNVRLTAAGARLLEEALPLLRALEERLDALDQAPGTLRVAAAESLVASWLPAALRAALDRIPPLELEIHAHRGTLVLERLRAGHADLAVCVSSGEDALHVEPLGEEPLVVVPSGLRPLLPAPGEVVQVWTIEAGSQTGAWLARRLPRLRGPFSVVPTTRIESFSSAVQLARAGFGHALAPVGIARSLGVPAERLVEVAGLRRPIAACAKPSGWERVRGLVEALRWGEGMAARGSGDGSTEDAAE